MKITLSNNAELNPILATGTSRTVHGVTRDTLCFVFPEETSLNELDDVFTEKNCEEITITDDDANEFIYHGYTVRVELCRKTVVAEQTPDEEETLEQRVFVTMAQRTYMEKQMAELQEALELILSGETGEEE